MSLKRGDFALVYFPHSDLRTVKLRPVLVVQAEERNTGLPQVVVAMVSSNLARAGHPSRVTVSVEGSARFPDRPEIRFGRHDGQPGDDRTATCQTRHRTDAANGSCRPGTSQYPGIVSGFPFGEAVFSKRGPEPGDRSKPSPKSLPNRLGRLTLLAAQAWLAAGLCRSRFKPNAPPRTPRSFNQPADGVKNGGNLCIVSPVFLFHFVQLPQNVSVRCKHPPQLNEGTHDDNIHQHGPMRLENAGKHRHALLGENIGRSPSSSPSFCSCNLQDQSLRFLPALQYRKFLFF